MEDSLDFRKDLFLYVLNLKIHIENGADRMVLCCTSEAVAFVPGFLP